MVFLRRKAVKPPGFYWRLNALTTVDLEWAGNRSSSNLRLDVGKMSCLMGVIRLTTLLQSGLFVG